MKKKTLLTKSTSKLTLAKETIRALNKDELASVNGGAYSFDAVCLTVMMASKPGMYLCAK
jgi:hypothetical protein